MMSRTWPAGMLVAAAALAVAAATPDEEIAAVHTLLMEGRDLSAVERFHALGFPVNDGPGNADAQESWRQYAPRLSGLIAPVPPATGEIAGAADIAAVATAERRDALTTIATLARDRRIVILNEAHDDPEHRSFALAVAKTLRPLGFSILAAETFNNDTDPSATDMAALTARGYPVRNTGVYTADPVFGDFVRQALALGYRPVAYEQTYAQWQGPRSDAIDAREEAQAANLAAAIARLPQARILVYVGYHHAAKTALTVDGRTHRWMAARLWQKTGSEPLSIDQTVLGSTSGTRSGRTLRDLARRRGLSRPTVLFGHGRPLRFGDWHDAEDLQVIHPAVRIVHGRPAWLAALGRHPVRPSAGLVPASGRALVQAFLPGERADAVPVDQVVVERGRPRWFMLPGGPVRFVVKERLP